MENRLSLCPTEPLILFLANEDWGNYSTWNASKHEQDSGIIQLSDRKFNSELHDKFEIEQYLPNKKYPYFVERALFDHHYFWDDIVIKGRPFFDDFEYSSNNF